MSLSIQINMNKCFEFGVSDIMQIVADSMTVFLYRNKFFACSFSHLRGKSERGNKCTSDRRVA